MDEPGASYAPTYYPGAIEFHRAEPIVLKPGVEKQADMAVGTVPAAKVHLRCPGSGAEGESCPGVARLTPEGMGGVPLDRLDAVPPGRYALSFVAEGTAAYKVIDVGSGDMTVDLNLEPVPVIEGKVAFRNGAPKPGSLQITLVDETTGEWFPADIDSDGGFRFSAVIRGKLRMSLGGEPVWFIAEMSAKGAPLKDGVLDATGSSEVHLNIVVSDERGRLKGFAMNGDAPAPETLVVLAPRDGYSEPLGFQTESDGSFDYTSVPAGDYLLFAVDKLDFEYANPEVTRPYLAAATAVHVPVHGVVEQRVKLAAAPVK